MPFQPRQTTKEAQDVLLLLDEAGHICDQLEAALADAREHRDHLARKASEAGATRRDVAKAARLTAGRVQQLLSR